MCEVEENIECKDLLAFTLSLKTLQNAQIGCLALNFSELPAKRTGIRRV